MMNIKTSTKIEKKHENAILVIRNEWINHAPKPIDLSHGKFSDKHLKLIIDAEKFKQLVVAYPAYIKVAATKLLYKYGMSSLLKKNVIDNDLQGYIKKLWILNLQARVMKLAVSLHKKIVFDEMFEKFIDDYQKKYSCTLLSKNEIVKIIPHLPLIKLHKEGQLKGALFDYTVKWWFFSKEDAERIAADKSDHIAKLKIRAKYKAHDRIVDENIDYIQRIVHGWLHLRGYICEGINSDHGFYATHIEYILNMPSVKQMISIVSVKEIGLPLDARVYFETVFENEMIHNSMFAALVTKELEERELDYLKYNKS